MRDLYLGIDVGSVSTNLVVVDGESRVTEQVYLRTNGRPIPTVQKGLAMIKKALGPHRIGGVGTTGSARHFDRADGWGGSGKE